MCTGLTHCSINVHQLIHLVYYARRFGPLWTHSAFAFEGQMHNFLKHSHATHGIHKQVIRVVVITIMHCDHNYYMPIDCVYTIDESIFTCTTTKGCRVICYGEVILEFFS